MLIPSIDLMGGRIVQLVQGEKLKLAFDDFEYWLDRFCKYPLVQLIDLDAAMRQGENRSLIEMICKRLPCQVGGGLKTAEDELVLAERDLEVRGELFFHAVGTEEGRPVDDALRAGFEQSAAVFWRAQAAANLAR